MLATVNILLRGIPFIYQGQEIGMRNCRMNNIEEYNDIGTVNEYNNALKAGLSNEEALEVCYHHSRDNARTPMQWSSSENAGFTTGTPWLKVNPNYTYINVEDELNDENSVLNYYKKLISLRKSKEYKEVFTYGNFVASYENEDNIYSYYREKDNKKVLILANFGSEGACIKLQGEENKILLSNIEDISIVDNNIKLESCAVAVIEVK